MHWVLPDLENDTKKLLEWFAPFARGKVAKQLRTVLSQIETDKEFTSGVGESSFAVEFVSDWTASPKPMMCLNV